LIAYIHVQSILTDTWDLHCHAYFGYR